MNEKIMIVDDDENIAELLSLYLKKDGFTTLKVHTGAAAIEKFSQFAPNLILLDVMLPQTDGYAVCREIRKTSNVPIIMVTAKTETFDKVLGLELGADDYITKPFDTKEVVARIKAVLRRYETVSENTEGDAIIQIPNLTINTATHTVTYKNEVVNMPLKEFELLHFFVSHANLVFTRDQLLEKIWGYEFMGDTRTVDVHIKRLREKITEEDNWGIKTVWGLGYKFVKE